MKEKEFSVDELTLLLKVSCRQVLQIKDFIRSREDINCIRDSKEVDYVRILRKVCQTLEAHVELPF